MNAPNNKTKLNKKKEHEILFPTVNDRLTRLPSTLTNIKTDQKLGGEISNLQNYTPFILLEASPPPKIQTFL